MQSIASAGVAPATRNGIPTVATTTTCAKRAAIPERSGKDLDPFRYHDGRMTLANEGLQRWIITGVGCAVNPLRPLEAFRAPRLPRMQAEGLGQSRVSAASQPPIPPLVTPCALVQRRAAPCDNLLGRSVQRRLAEPGR